MSELRTEQLIRALQDKAEQALSDAELLVDNGSVEAAINRGYYAAFQTARAALLLEGESPKTHSGVMQRFGYHFVRTGAVAEEIGDILAIAQSMRGQADYEIVADLSAEDASKLVEDVRRFIMAVDERIHPSGSSRP